MNILGSPTKTIFLQAEPNKIYLEFQADVAVKKGQPVKLTATGEITPWAPADTTALLIGYVYTSDAAADELVTVITRGFCLINAISGGALNPGPVDYSAYDAATDVGGLTGWNKYVTGTANANGWSLDVAAGANLLIRVLMRD